MFAAPSLLRGGKNEMKVLLKDTVSFQGREAKAGEILDLPERSAKSLITAELAADVPEQPLRLPDPGDNDLGVVNYLTTT
ncbi:MAG: hypothetical protein NHB14_20760 [Desulfosporosinus sp.]|nr:hypothetical protein [Desulfosporosinus sp.]